MMRGTGYTKWMAAFMVECPKEKNFWPLYTLKCSFSEIEGTTRAEHLIISYGAEVPKVTVYRKKTIISTHGKDYYWATKEKHVISTKARKRIGHSLKLGYVMSCEIAGYPKVGTIVEIPKEYKKYLSLKNQNSIEVIKKSDQSYQSQMIFFLCMRKHQKDKHHRVYIYVDYNEGTKTGDIYRQLATWCKYLLFILVPTAWFLTRRFISLELDRTSSLRGGSNRARREKHRDHGESTDNTSSLSEDSFF